MLYHSLFRIFPVFTNPFIPFCPHKFMSIRVYIKCTRQPVQLPFKVPHKWSYSACQHIDNGILYLFFFNFLNAVTKCCQIIIHGSRWSDIRHLHPEAFRIMISKFFIMVGHTRHMVLNFFTDCLSGQILYKCLEPAVSRRNSFTAYNKYMFHFLFLINCCKFCIQHNLISRFFQTSGKIYCPL